MIETTLPDNTGGPFSKPGRGGCLRARMNAATMTTTATTNTSNEPMRPIAGIFSLIIKRLPASIAGRVDYTISFAPDAVHQERRFAIRKIVAKCQANWPVCSCLANRLIGDTRANGGQKNRGQKIGDRNIRDAFSVPYFLSDGRNDDQCQSLKLAG